MTKPGVIDFRETPSPQPGPGQVLLRIRRIGVCGSDVHVYHGKHPFTRFPVVQGHEFSAIVETVGEGVTDVAVGTKVTATPQEVCGRCGPCRSGRYNVCESLKVRGFQAPGVAQDLFVTEVDKLVVLPDSFTPEQGAFVEPVAVAAHSTGQADMVGRNVVVAGAGPIGNLVAQACRCRGAAKVLITDVSAFRLKVAREVGIEAVANAREELLASATARVFGDDGFDVGIDAAGVEASITELVAAIRKGGTVLILAVFEDKPPMDLSVICEHELTVRGSMMYRKEDYEQAVRWIADGSICLAPLESRHFPFEQFLDAYRFIEDQGQRVMKVMIDL